MYRITVSKCVHTHALIWMSQQSCTLSRAVFFYYPKFSDEKSDSKRSSFPNSGNPRLDGARSSTSKSFPEWLPLKKKKKWWLFKILTGNQKVLGLMKEIFESHCTKWKYPAWFSEWGLKVRLRYYSPAFTAWRDRQPLSLVQS